MKRTEDFINQRELVASEHWCDADAFFTSCTMNLEDTQFKGWLTDEQSEQAVFRGQADSRHGISSSLFRAISNLGNAAESDGSVSEYQLYEAERSVIDGLRAEGLGHRCTDLQLLYLLQHQEIPTRLVDVSRSCLPSLYFAVNSQTHLDGRMFVIQVQKQIAQLDLLSEDLPWQGMAIGPTYANSEWTNSVILIDQIPFDPRMIAQDGAFLVGGIAKNVGDTHYTLTGEASLTAAERLQVSTLNLQFPKQAGEFKRFWGGRAWTIRIPASWKPDLIAALRGMDEPIYVDSMMPDYVGSRRLGARLAQSTAANTGH